MTLERGPQVHDDDDEVTRFLREHGGELGGGASVGCYILNADGEPELCDDLLTWGQWMATANRFICQDMDEGQGDQRVRVSTVFLGVDHRLLRGGGPPTLWETMVFGGPLSGTQRRYTSRDDAFKGHQLICQQVSAAQPKPPQ